MAERKRPRRTRERIIETSLVMFNRLGEPNVTTADIADEMGISPGNLYYHFRNKDDIIAELFGRFERRLSPVVDLRASPPASVEDLWLVLHLWFEAMWDLRFLYRDLDEILSRDKRLAARFARLTRGGTRTVIELCRSMVAAGTMLASGDAIGALGENVTLVATYWISYQRIFAGERAVDAVNLDRAAYQVLSLVTPWLHGSERALLDRMRRDYL